MTIMSTFGFDDSVPPQPASRRGSRSAAREAVPRAVAPAGSGGQFQECLEVLIEVRSVLRVRSLRSLVGLERQGGHDVRPRSREPRVSPTVPRILFVLLALAGCGGGSQESISRNAPGRLLVLGWDGATFDLVDPLLARGRLPNLARLVEAGQTAYMESTRIPISSAAWVGATTGRGPGETGVYDFFDRAPGSRDLKVIDARSNRCSPVWRILSNRGHVVNVFGVPVTWPPEPVNGRMVAGMLAPPSEAWAWPPEYTDSLRAAGLVPDVGMWTQRKNIDLPTVFKQIELKEQELVRLLAQDDWSFSMVVFKSLDVVSHQVYDGRTEGVVAQLLSRLDSALGSMLEAAGPETNVLLMSDHGFTTYAGSFNVASWLVEQGYAVRKGEEVAVPWGDRSYTEFTLDVETRRLAAVDLARTRVLASETECEGHFGSLRLNLAGRDPDGVVPEEEADSLLTELSEALLAVRSGDQKVVTRVWRGSELYPGPESRVVPDLIFETMPDREVVANDRQPTLVRWDVPRPDHNLDGILVASGPDIAPSAERGRWSILDLAPTALTLLGEPAYVEMDGIARTEILRVKRGAVLIKEEDDPTHREPDEAWKPVELNADARREQIERLRELGYADDE